MADNKSSNSPNKWTSVAAYIDSDSSARPSPEKLAPRYTPNARGDDADAKSSDNVFLATALMAMNESIRAREEAARNGQDNNFMMDFLRRFGFRPEDDKSIIPDIENTIAEPPKVEDFIEDLENGGKNGVLGSAAAAFARGNFAANPNTKFDGSALSGIMFVLGKEGLFSNNVHDNGGATMMGIASKSWPRDYANIMQISRTQGVDAARAYAVDFYQRHFWDPVERMVDAKYHNLPEAQRQALTFAAFDAAVNGGMGLANRLLNRSNGDVETFMHARLAHLQSLDDWSHFGRGWGNRVNSVASAALGYEQRAHAPTLALN